MTDEAPIVYQGKRINVKKVEGKDVIEHPGSVVILPLLDPQKIVFIKNKRVAVGKTLYELPAGTLDESELPLVCAKRELEEETGFQAKTLKPLCNFYSAPGYSNEKLHAFTATDLTLKKQKLDPDEEIDVEIITYTKALEMMRTGEIEDGKTILALLYYALY